MKKIDATLLGGGSNLDYEETSGNILFGEIKLATTKTEFMPLMATGLNTLNDLYEEGKEWDKINTLVNCLRAFLVWL